MERLRSNHCNNVPVTSSLRTAIASDPQLTVWTHATRMLINAFLAPGPAELLSADAVVAGFADPVYAEAYVTVHQYDIVLDVTVINRTNETLQNLCLELATMGDLKLVERPQNYTLGPGAQKSIRC